MLNLSRSLLGCLAWTGGGLMINKRWYPNFIYMLFVLTVWLFTYTRSIRKRKGTLTNYNSILIGSVLLAFKTKELLLFYVFFELRAVPITVMIFQYGYQPEKLNAALFLMLYTVVRRLPLLLAIMFWRGEYISSSISCFPVTFGFMVKTPIYLLHT